MDESPFKRHEPLYLKYRPQSLGDLVGQDGVRRTLENAITHNKLTHAYLFTGPRGTGKTSSARILAKSLNCKTAGRPTVEPCQTCSCCMEITNCNSPAVFEIDAASNNSVDDARVLIERAPLKAVGGEFKVYIIDECHMLTKEAFNALLKTIEQPPAGVVFILATTEEHKVIPTIVSRCQRLMFKLINQDDLMRHLQYVAQKESISIEDEALRLIARRSGGGLRDALSNLDQASLLASPEKPATVQDLLKLLGALHEDVLLEISEQLAQKAGQLVIDSVNKLLAEGREPPVVLQELSRHFLSLMKASYIGDSGTQEERQSALKNVVLGSDSYVCGLLEQCKLFERSELSQIVQQLDKLEQTTRRSSQPAMHLEIGLLGICHRHDIHLLNELLARIEKLEEQLSNVQSGSEPLYQKLHHASSRPQAPVNQTETPRSASPAAEASRAQASRPPQPEPAAEASRAQASRPPQPEPAAEASRAQASRPPQPEPAREAAAPEDTPDRQAAVDDPRAAQLNEDLDYVWQQILDELQRRHLPTFSLASTHAFPLGIDSREIALGVMKEGLQKMLESKIEHIKNASKSVTGLDLAVRIRVSAEQAQAPAQKKAVAASTRTSSRREEFESAAEDEAPAPLRKQEPEAVRAQSEEEHIREGEADNGQGNLPETASGEFDATMVKEAYKLFEGPGSRRIS